MIFNYPDNYDTRVIPTPHQTPAFGDDYELTCTIKNEGRPREIIRYVWSKDEMQINEFSKYDINRNSLIIKVVRLFHLTFTEVMNPRIVYFLISFSMCW